MGSGASKAAQNTTRRFPARAPGAAAPPSAPRAPRPLPSKKSSPGARPAKDEATRADGLDPDAIDANYARRLAQMGVVQPNPTYSPSSTASPAALPPEARQQRAAARPARPPAARNSTLGVLEARRRIEQQAESELEGTGAAAGEGRQFLNAGMLRDLLVMRERGAAPEQIEARMNLRPGVVKRLGPRGLVAPVGGSTS